LSNNPGGLCSPGFSISGYILLMWLAIIAYASDCDELATADSQRNRLLQSALTSTDPGPWRSSEQPWRLTMTSTCEWADTLAPGCLRAPTCVLLHGQDRLATISTASPQARALELARLTGRWDCAPARGRDCATQAQEAEDARLMTVVAALSEAGAPAQLAQRQWFSYRDSGCEAEATRSAGEPDDWSRAACAATLAHRRTELLTALAATDPSVGPLVEDARFKAAERGASGGRAWQRWLEEAQGDTPRAELFVLLREALEARADGAALPVLAQTEAWGRCEAPGSAECVAAVRAETGALREVEVGATSVSEAWLRAERSWRTRWCSPLVPLQADLCEAAIDWVVVEALEVPR
jgi:uncharacterized protein YecT (DUF1311 family)